MPTETALPVETATTVATVVEPPNDAPLPPAEEIASGEPALVEDPQVDLDDPPGIGRLHGRRQRRRGTQRRSLDRN